MRLPPLSRRQLLGSMAAAALLPFGRAAAQAPAPERHRHGWDPGIEGPREASFHVAPDGDDAGPGTRAQPLRSLRRGVARLAERGSGSLALHGGIYREAVSLEALQGASAADGSPAYRLHRFGTDRVTISAAERLTGWRPCPPETAARFGLPAQEVHLARLPFAALAHGDIGALNLHENGLYSPLAGWRANKDRPLAVFDHRSMRRAEFETRGERNVIVAVRDPVLVGQDPEALRDAKVLVYRHPNSVSSLAPARFDPATGTIHLPAEPELILHQRGAERSMFYALQNVPLAMERGEWFARRAGDMVEVYFWPKDPGHLESAVEVSLRDHCIDTGAASSVELFGLEMIRAAGSMREAGSCLRRTIVSRASGGQDLRVIHCRAGENLVAAGTGYGAIYLREALRPVLLHCTIEACRSSVGLAMDNCRDADVRHLDFRDISRSGARFFGLEGGIFAFSRFENTGWDAHSNKFHFYQGSDRVLVYGVRTRNTGGYVTFQRASRIHFAFCDFDCDPNSQNRGLVSQNREPGRPTERDPGDGTGDPRPGSTFWYWNLTLQPQSRGGPQPANALALGPKMGSHRHVWHNSLVHGGGYSSIYSGATPRDRETRSHNHYTALAHWQSAKYGWGLEKGETAGRTRPGLGKDMRATIQTEIAPLFPSFHDWDKDIDGLPVDWSLPPIGARASPG